MPTRLWLRLTEFAFALILAALLLASWRPDRREHAQLAADLAAAIGAAVGAIAVTAHH